MSPFWNHILGFIYVEIAKIAVTWKLAKKIVSGWGFEPGTKIALTIGAAPHPPPRLLRQSPFFLYTIGYIWIHMHENLGHRGYEFILFYQYAWIHRSPPDMNSYFLMYEFISGGAMCEVPPSLWRHLTHQRSISLLPRPIRVRSAAPTS